MESKGEMKPGEMTAEELVRLLRKYAAALYDYRIAELNSTAELEADGRVEKYEAEILRLAEPARLNAGGAPGHFEMTPEIAAKGTLVTEDHLIDGERRLSHER